MVKYCRFKASIICSLTGLHTVVHASRNCTVYSFVCLSTQDQDLHHFVLLPFGVKPESRFELYSILQKPNVITCSLLVKETEVLK